MTQLQQQQQLTRQQAARVESLQQRLTARLQALQ